MANAVSRRPYAIPIKLCDEFKRLEIKIDERKGYSVVFAMEVQPTLAEDIRAV